MSGKLRFSKETAEEFWLKEFWLRGYDSTTAVLKFPRVSHEEAYELEKIGNVVRREEESGWGDLDDVSLDGSLCFNHPSTGFNSVHVKRALFRLEELEEIAERFNNLMVRRRAPPPPLASLLSGSLRLR